MNATKVSWLKTQDSLTVSYDGEVHTILATSKEYSEAVDAIRCGNLDALPDIVARAMRAINRYGNGRFAVRNGTLQLNTVDGWRELPVQLADRILAHEAEGLPIEPLCRFAENLLENPSARAVSELFAFLEANRHPITDDGCFIAYRAVRPDFRDKHTGTFDNSPGRVCRMPRNAVDEDSNVTCSRGLHVAGYDYARNHYGSAGDPVIECKVNPRDVVAVPRDYGNSKMRVCEYRVIQVIDAPRDTLDYADYDAAYDTDYSDD